MTVLSWSPAPATRYPATPDPITQSAATQSAEPGSGGRSPAAGGSWRRWRLWAGVGAVIVIAAVLIVALQPARPVIGYLDPRDTGPYGSHALADILAGRGTAVAAVTAPAAAASAAAAGRPAATLVITSPQYLSRPQLGALAAAGRAVVIVEPDTAVLAALAPRLSLGTARPAGVAVPGCALRAARLAGSADLGGRGFRLQPGTPGAAECYRAGGLPSLVQYRSGRRTITVLGAGALLANSYLARSGNAALAMNLLGAYRQVIWLVPAVPAAGPGTGGSKSLTSLIPLGAYLVAVQLALAVMLTALWRTRRLGPLVSEQLPVVVRAVETAEGHARLYQARRARGRAAATLQAAALARLLPALGLPRSASPGSVTAAVSPRSALGAERVSQILFGPAPASDTALIALADELDQLEREVLAQ